MITKLDRTTLRALRASINAALAALASQHGISISVGNASYTDSTAVFKLNLAVKNPDGTVASRDREDFIQYASLYGMKPEWLGCTFQSLGKAFKIIGLAPKRRKNPIICQEARTGKNFVFPAHSIVALMTEGSPMPATANTKSRMNVAIHAEVEKRIAEMRREAPENYYHDGEFRANGMSEKQIHDYHYNQIMLEVRGEGKI